MHNYLRGGNAPSVALEGVELLLGLLAHLLLLGRLVQRVLRPQLQLAPQLLRLPDVLPQRVDLLQGRLQLLNN